MKKRNLFSILKTVLLSLCLVAAGVAWEQAKPKPSSAELLSAGRDKNLELKDGRSFSYHALERMPKAQRDQVLGHAKPSRRDEFSEWELSIAEARAEESKKSLDAALARAEESKNELEATHIKNEPTYRDIATKSNLVLPLLIEETAKGKKLGLTARRSLQYMFDDQSRLLGFGMTQATVDNIKRLLANPNVWEK